MIGKTNSRYERCKEYMSQEGLDAVIALSPENVFYFGETYISTQKTIRDRLAMVVMPLEYDPAIIACIIEKNTVIEETWIEDIRTYVEFKESPIKLLADALKEKGLGKKRVGIELDYLMAHYYRELIGLLPDAELVLCTKIFDKVRMIKEKKEIDILAYAGFSTRKAFEAAVLASKPGDTEKDLSKRAIKNLIDLGCDETTFMALASGKRSMLVHALPEEVPLESGEIVRIDFGGLFSNYNSDVARTAMIGRPVTKHIEVFMRLSEAYFNTYKSMAIGIPASEVYFTAKRNYEAAGLPFHMAHTGHALGISVHEFPILSPTENQPLLEDMVLCLEHSAHVDGYRYHVEDLIQITKSGPRVLTDKSLNPRLLQLA